MTVDIKIRPCRLEEVPELREFWRISAAGESPTDDASSINILFRSCDDAVLLAEADGRIVGTIIAVFDGWRGNIYRLGVHPDYRRLGIGRKLVAEAERRLALRGAKRLVALASQHSPLAVPFWDSMRDEGWLPSHPKQRYAKTLKR